MDLGIFRYSLKQWLKYVLGEGQGNNTQEQNQVTGGERGRTDIQTLEMEGLENDSGSKKLNSKS